MLETRMVNVTVTKSSAIFGFVSEYLSNVLSMLVHGAWVIFNVKFGTYPQKRSADPELRLEGLEV